MGKLIVLDHPLVQHKVTILRNIETNTKEFKEVVSELSMLLFYEASKDLELSHTPVKTPLAMAEGASIETKIAIVPVLRAGIGMTEGVTQLIPSAKVGHIGIFREPETFVPVEYYCKLPVDVNERKVYILEPMLATGGTTTAAIEFLKDRQVNISNITLLSIIVAPEGVKKVQSEYPDTDIYLAALDRNVDEQGYIVPGLGDAGDRMFGTK